MGDNSGVGEAPEFNSCILPEFLVSKGSKFDLMGGFLGGQFDVLLVLLLYINV